MIRISAAYASNTSIGSTPGVGKFNNDRTKVQI
jgi:hypothetical protein